jgi:hypothetical protein
VLTLSWIPPLAWGGCSPDAGLGSLGGGGPDAAHFEDVSPLDSAADDERTVDGAPGNCTDSREQLLQPIDAISSGEVMVLAGSPAVRTVYLDASAGGTQAAGANPRLYLNLETATKVAVTDRTAPSSLDWDLAIKRPIVFTNSGDAGAGRGGAVFLEGKDFDAVTAADVAGKELFAESFFESDCAPKVDATGAVKTSFDGWYDYDQTTNSLSPRHGTWIVRGATGGVHKVQILSYYGALDGGAGQSGGRYLLKVAAL